MNTSEPTSSDYTGDVECVYSNAKIRAVLKTSVVSWMYLPDDLLFGVFELLSCKDLSNAGRVCTRWKALSNKEYLWKRRLHADFNLKSDLPLHPGAISWRQEYERLSDRVPCIELDKIEEHADEVLHVAFSNNGMMFCTCSKDAYVKVYNADWPFNTVFSSHLGGTNNLFRWKYTQMSQFSPCDTQLLVSGRCSGSEQGGEIVIYNIFAGSFSVQARVRIKPYDVMGTWLNETHILSARAHCISRSFNCLCEVILNKSAQEIENTRLSTVTRTFLFRCDNFATVSYLQVADLARPIRQVVKRQCNGELRDILHEMHVRHLARESEIQQQWKKQCENKEKICTNCIGKPSPEREVKRIKMTSPHLHKQTTTCFSFCSKTSQYDSDHDSTSDHDANILLKSCGMQATDTDSIADTPRLRNASEHEENHHRQLILCTSCGKPMQESKMDDSSMSEVDSSSATSADEDANTMPLPDCYKLLICFTGNLVYIPHQIGIKIIKQEECSKVVDRDISSLLTSFDYNRPELDTWDHVLELQGQGVGMTISPCNRYLYVNVRRWIGNWEDDIANNFDHTNPPPKISIHIDLVVYDLVTMSQVSTLTGHNAFSDVFFLHLSSNDLYVASGSEDARGYIWDRYYGACIASLPHDNVVNCVAVNPRDPSMAVSVSDDRSVKIWRSRAFNRLLKGARAKSRIKFRTHAVKS